MYTPAPSAAELEAAGLSPDDMAGEVVEIWPENRNAYEVFRRMTRQWNVGMSGITGLNLDAVPLLMQGLQIPQSELLDLLDALDVMSGEAIRIINKD